MTSTDWSADLDEFVEGGPLPPDDEPLPPIEGQEHADIWLRRIARLRSEHEQIDAIATAEIERISSWRADRLSGVGRDIERIVRHVELWARSQLTGKRRSLSLPWGTPSLRKATTSVVTTDAKAFEQWALANGRELLLLPAKVREPDKRAVAEHLVEGHLLESDDELQRFAVLAVDESTGEREIVPGVVMTRAKHDPFTIKPPKEVGS